MTRSKVLSATVVGVVAIAAVFVFQLTSAAGQGAKRRAQLSGAAEVPGPGDADGSGKAVVRIKEKTGKLCFSLSWRDIGDPTAAHVHEGAADVAGPALITLLDNASGIAAPVSKVGGCIEGLDQSLLRALKKSPGNYYVNVHNAEFPGGAIRGQLQKPE